MEEEFKQGMRHGKSTWYWADGKIDNRVYVDDQRMEMHKVQRPKDAFFGDGIPYKKKPVD